MDFFKKHLVLIAFLLPFVLVVIVAAMAYLPSSLLTTNYNFIYAICEEGRGYYYYGCNAYLDRLYDVENGMLVVRDVDTNQDLNGKVPPGVDEEDYSVRLFLHDTAKNESREITLEEARALSLNGLLTSDDGVTVSYEYDRGPDFIFVFDGGSSQGYYLTKGRARSKLHLINDQDRYYYRDNFHFIGWVLPGRDS